MINEEEAIKLLKKYSKDEKVFKIVLDHSKTVQEVALEIAKDVPNLDLELIKIGSLLHDIGRFECKPGAGAGIKHGVFGAEILRKEGLDEIADIAERHLGAGISKEEVKEQRLDLPLKDYLPVTKEQKIITHADNLVSGDKRISLKKAVERYRKELGEKAASKVKKLADEVENMKSIK